MIVAKKARYWGQDGRFVDVHRLPVPFTEGNGFVYGRKRADKDRGTGEGVTWRCATDTNISNRKKDCNTNWRGGSMSMAVVATDSILHTNDLVAGDTVQWDVTNDVIAAIGEGKTEIRWVVKKELEWKWGKIVYYSKEGAVAEGNTDLAPKLILE